MAEAKNPSIDKVLSALGSIDAPMLQSKKFVAFMTIQICGTALMFFSIWMGQSDTVLMTIQGTIGAAQSGYLGFQAWHDRHVKPAKVSALNGSVTAAVNRSDPDAAKAG